MGFNLNDFGKDHWSTFAYAECCCVDLKGRLDLRRLRMNSNKRPVGNGGTWQPSYGSFVKGERDPEHDDWDCLEDLEAEGLIEMVGTMVNPAVTLTERGYEIAGLLRKHKANGGQFGTFEL